MKKLVLILTILTSSSALASHWGEYNTKKEAQYILDICSNQASVLMDKGYSFTSGEYIGSMSPVDGSVSTTYWILFSTPDLAYETLVLHERSRYSEESTLGIISEFKCEIKTGDQVAEY